MITDSSIKILQQIMEMFQYGQNKYVIPWQIHEKDEFKDKQAISKGGPSSC